LALPRRIKTVTIDGAEFKIAPLTYNELEEYGERVKTAREKRLEFEKQNDDKEAASPPELQKEMRNNAFFAICCGLNNAIPEIIAQQDLLFREQISSEDYDKAIAAIAITPKQLLAQVDDLLGAQLASEILNFNGLQMPSKAELLARSRAGVGETQASS